MTVTLAALILPLSLDTFAVAAVLGIAGLPPSDRLRVALLFTAFEAGMPVAGLLAGLGLGRLAGGYAEWLAVAVLLGVGAWMLLSRDGDERRGSMLARTRGLAALGLGLSISTDELAIGFTLGLVGVPVAVAAVLIALQAFVASQLGFRLGARVGERVAEGAERVAGAALVVAAMGLAAARLAGLEV